jgi:hypothetical protein
MAEFASRTDPQRIETQSQHHMMLMKGTHCWRFSWMNGDEDQLITTVSDLAANVRTEFDWFDAAVVRHQLDEYINEQYGTTD